MIFAIDTGCGKAGASRYKQSGEEAIMSSSKLPETDTGTTKPCREKRAAATENSGASFVL